MAAVPPRGFGPGSRGDGKRDLHKMSTLYLDRRDLSLELQGRTLVLRREGEIQGTVPLHLVERVVMRSAVAMESGLLARLADAGVGINFEHSRRSI